MEQETTGLKYIVYRGDPRNKKVHLYAPRTKKPVCNTHGVNAAVLDAERVLLNNGWGVCSKCLDREERNVKDL